MVLNSEHKTRSPSAHPLLSAIQCSLSHPTWSLLLSYLRPVTSGVLFQDPLVPNLYELPRCITCFLSVYAQSDLTFLQGSIYPFPYPLLSTLHHRYAVSSVQFPLSTGAKAKQHLGYLNRYFLCSDEVTLIIYTRLLCLHAPSLMLIQHPLNHSFTSRLATKQFMVSVSQTLMHQPITDQSKC